MENLQLWLAPLLSIIAAITSIVTFVRLCRPIWKAFMAPKELTDKIDTLNKKLDSTVTKIDSHFVDVENRLDKQEDCLTQLSIQNQKEDGITINLLHDAIIQIYKEAQRENRISEIDYYRACELYKQNGNSQYIDSLMQALTEIHLKNVEGV